MPFTESGLRAHWADLAADPARTARIRDAQRAAERRNAERRRATAPRPIVLAPAPAPATAVAAVQGPATLVRNDAAGTRVNIFEEIGPWGICAADFAAALAAAPAGDLTCHISSPGGDIFEGLAIMNQLRQRPGRVTVVVDGLAASAASAIAMAADPGRLYMAPNTSMMIHSAWAVTIGDEVDHRAAADILSGQSDNLAAVYAARSGRPASDMRDLMRAETWFIGPEAVAAGLADAMLPDSGQVPEPGSWDALAAQLATKAQLDGAGPGRPGNPALRAQAYSRWTAQSGHAQGRMSPFVAAMFRAGL